MFQSVVLVILGLMLMRFLVNWLRNVNIRRKIINHIPGPHGKPILGNVLDMLISTENMWIYLRKLAEEYYPIYKLWLGGVPIINLLCPEDIEVVLSTTKHSEKSDIYRALHPWLGQGLLTSKGKRWQSRRKILTPTFHFNILQQFIGVFVEESELLVQELRKECDKPDTNIVPIITQSTLRSICETAMGTAVKNTHTKWQEYTKAIHRMGELILFRIVRPWYFPDSTYSLSATYTEQKKTVNVLHTFSKSIIENRKSNFKELEPEFSQIHEIRSQKRRLAMLDLLLSAQNAGELIDDDGIREEVDTFMFEGHDTTTACVSFTLLLLANHRDVQEQVVQELREVFGDSDRVPAFQDLQNLFYLDRVLKESLRLYPSVPFISRVADEDIHTPSGYIIPAKSIVNVHIYDLHRNPRLFPKPHKFNPDRFLPQNAKGRHPFAYIPFSAGPRNCIGQKFAILEIKTMISAILRNFVLEASNSPADITMTIHLVLRTKHGIRIKFRERVAGCSTKNLKRRLST